MVAVTLELEDVEAAAGCPVEVVVAATQAEVDAVAGAYKVMGVLVDVEVVGASIERIVGILAEVTDAAAWADLLGGCI